MARAFADVLREIAGGSLYEDLGVQLGELVQAVVEHRKAGEMTLKIKVQPNGESSVKLVDELKMKVPEPNRGVSIFFVTAGGSLIRNDPRQPDLPLRSVKETEMPLKEVSNG